MRKHDQPSPHGRDAEPTSPTALRRTIWIEAPPATVYQYFVDAERMALWMGRTDMLEARPGGAIRILKSDDMTMRGEFLALEPPHRVVFTFGWEGRADLPAGSSRVEVRLTPDAGGTRVDLVHDGLSEERFEAKGWTHSLERLRIAAGPA